MKSQNKFNNYIELIATLNKVGKALSAEKDNQKLLEMILNSAKELTQADGGTLYLVNNDIELKFVIIENNTLEIKSAKALEFASKIPSIPLYIDGQPNLKNVASYCFHKNQTINIEDAYHDVGFDFSGMRHTDAKLGYRSKSFLTIPLRDHENKTIGVLQLINAIDKDNGEIISFGEDRIVIAESLASQAAISLTNQALIEAQKKLFNSLLKFIAKAIDEKSAYTSNHCIRVPILTMMIANAINRSRKGPFKDFVFSKDQSEELSIAAWLHDCGKLVIPDHVMNKSTKLEALSDRIEIIDLRFEILKRDEKINYLEKSSNASPDLQSLLKKNYEAKIKFLDAAQQFIRQVNIGGEILLETDQNKIQELASLKYQEGNQSKPLLSKNDIENLSIIRGTLNNQERIIIQSHAAMTQTMLQSLPYPKHLKDVPIIASCHHERIDGKGYPHGYNKEKIPLQARILAIADIFEALTSADRPYKKAKPLSEVLSIMQNMKNDGHIDPDLYDLFIKTKIHLKYAKKYLNPKQIDELKNKE